ncbi:MAG: ABC transporter substrate-binding protein, partial [Gemmatimonadetes bacterium]|nr:ABC transporter substrate-binding protein [Gemmatimonadota bacterium]
MGRRQILSWLAPGAVLLVAPACAEREGAATSGRSPADHPQYGGNLHLMLESPGTLDPSAVDDVYESCIVNQLYDGLLEFDSNLNAVPCIAQDWSISRDGRTYEFRLRDDVTFHNGRRVTADDFVYSFTRIFHPDREDLGLGAEYLRKIRGAKDFAAGRAESIVGLAAPSEDVLRIDLEQPYASFLSALAMDQTKVVAREEIERWGGDDPARACGTGPFTVEVSRIEAAEPTLVLRANEDYFRGRPFVDRLVFHVPSDYNVDVAVDALLAGELTLTDYPGAWDDRFRSDADFRVTHRPELSFSFVGFNVGLDPARNATVRRALAHGINRDRIAALDPRGRVPVQGILPPGMFGYSPEFKVLDYDPETAARLLAEAGFPGGAGLDTLHYWQADRGELGHLADKLMRE